MKICPNCANEHIGATSRCGYCLAVADQRPQRGNTAQSLSDDRVNDAYNEHQHSNAESLDGGWVE
mgnify:FL=1